jgi:predicted transcriptional regulator
VTLREVKEILDAEVLVGHDSLDLEVNEAGCVDLMADVLFFGKPGMILLTGLGSPDVIRTAHTLRIAALILVRGKRPLPETIQLAEELQVPLLTTKYILFVSAGRLYSKGIIGCIEKVYENHDLP